MIRVGFGIDVHRFVENRDLWIGGVKIPYEFGLAGHSDADVLIHAICDALLGAANLRDIGFQFPDTSDEFLNIDSKILLRRTGELLKEKGYRIGNIDSTVAAQAPKLNPHIPQMQHNPPLRYIQVQGKSMDQYQVLAENRLFPMSNRTKRDPSHKENYISAP